MICIIIVESLGWLIATQKAVPVLCKTEAEGNEGNRLGSPNEGLRILARIITKACLADKQSVTGTAKTKRQFEQSEDISRTRRNCSNGKHCYQPKR